MQSVYSLQRWVIVTSLVSSGCLIAFFLLCRSLLGYPLEAGETQQLTQLVVPPFFGYLALAVRHTTAQPTTLVKPLEVSKLLPLLLRGTGALYLLIVVLALVAYYVANAPIVASTSDTGPMTFSDLSRWICAGLALQTSTFGIIVGSLFGAQGNPPPVPLQAKK